MKNQIIVLLGFALILLIACNLPDKYFTALPECDAQEAFQEQYEPMSEAYQQAVLMILKDKKPADFEYVFKTFIDEGEQSYMLTNFRSEDYCFDAKVLVNKWDKLAGMKRTNGVSYPNRLFDLKWSLVQVEDALEIVYEDMHDIID